MLNWLRSCVWLWCIVSLGLTLTESGPLLANDPAAAAPIADEDDEPARFPGIIGTYTAFGRSVSRRDADIAFVWNKVSPVQQLHDGLFKAEWQGKLLVRAPGKHRFYAQVQGEVEAILANQPILKGKTDAGRPAEWITGPEFDFEYGEHPLDVTFRSNWSSARVKLYWSSEAFSFEPIPSAAYFLHKPRPDLELVSQGQELFAAHRCNRCHRRQSDPRGPPAPDLTNVSYGLTDATLERWLSPEQPATAHFNMPEFGFTAAESRSIAHYLRANSSVPTLAPDAPLISKAKPDKLLADGRLLFHTIGCLACHTYGEVGSRSRLGGGDLTTIGAKRSAEWLRQWLTQPAKINADHRMPVFKWDRSSDKDELQEMVAFLASSRSDAAKPATDAVEQPPTPESIAEGRKLIEAARCAACHRIPGMKNPDTSNLSKLENLNAIGKNSCLQVQPNRENWRPGFPAQDLEALRAYIKSRTGKLGGEGTTERGQRQLAWNNCLQCHPREGTPGLGAYAVSITKLFPELNGSVPTLIPPSLNAVGDKLQSFALAEAIRGTFPNRRLPWLKVRMPQFTYQRHENDERETGLALHPYFINHDRIDNPPEELVAPLPVLDDNQRLQAQAVGHTLLGSQGFSCIACHQYGRFTPRNTALGTRGSDLHLLVRRMRPEYFLRWTRSPIRVVPDMEMPGFERPFPGLLDGKIQPQLWALWLAANDANVTRPVDVSSLQQSWLVRAGEPARIVRDVFALPPNEDLHAGGPDRPADTYLPRAFAVGLNNQHNMLFDLDTFAVREWWQGNFARQRTEGKSWYWDMGGPRVVNGIANYPQIVLSHGEYEHPTGQLIEYGPHEQGVKLVYTLKLRECEGAAPDAMRVTENWQPMAPQEGSKKSGWLRKISVIDVPKGLTPSFYLSRSPRPTESWDIKLVPGSLSRFYQRPCVLFEAPHPQYAPIGNFAEFIKTTEGPFALELQYVSNSTLPGIETPEVPPVISTQETYSTVPGYTATRLPLPRSIMPTAMTWTKENVMAFTSLKGHVYFVRDTNGDGLEDKLDLFEEGLAAPYGIITDATDGSLLVAHKPEILRLTDTNKDG
ncbi:MAG: Cytochrome c, partial [Planctomycetaceae bacterium]|nr:Cytochrome c [Planctomycetaceae bacterium]